MSDLFEVRQKVEEGADWRGSITVHIDDDAKQLTTRQLRDPEFWEVMSLVDTDEIEDLQDQLPEEKMEELNDLQDKDEDDLTDEESERMAALQEEIEEEQVDVFATLSEDTFEGIQKAAKYGIEPDQQDIQRVLTQYGGEVNDAYGRADEDAARKWANQHVIEPMIDRSTGFTSFTIGVNVLTETIGEMGNSES